MTRPRRLLAVVGTGTEIGKTWVSVRLLASARDRGLAVAARKPAQSFDPTDSPDQHDSAQLAAATGEAPEAVCPPHRCYPVAMAPPMAADALGSAPLELRALLDELTWPPGVDLGLVETAGGVASPLTHDASCADLVHALDPDLVVMVADAGLGTINAVRLSAVPLAPLPLVVVLNRFEADLELHRANHRWLEADGFETVTEIDQLLGRTS